MQEVANTVHKYLCDGWEAEFGTSEGSNGPASTEGSGASVHSAGEVPSQARCKGSEHKDKSPSPPMFQPVEVNAKTVERIWAKKALGGMGEGGEEDDLDAYINVSSRQTEVEELESENDFARSSTWVDGEPDEEYIISMDRFKGQNSGNSVAMLLPGNRHESTGSYVVEGELIVSEHETSIPIYSNSSMMSLQSLHSAGNHSSTPKCAPPTAKSHTHGLRPSRSTEDGLSSNLQGKPPKIFTSMHTLQ